MPLELHPITTSDTLSWTRIRMLAYLGPTHELIHGGQPISESSIQGVARDRVKELGKRNTWHWKIVDTDLSPSGDDPEGNSGRTIAIAVWSAHNLPAKEVEGSSNEPTTNPAETASEERAEEEKEKPFLPPELNLEILLALLGPLNVAQAEIMGSARPYLMLNSLATHPEHQRRGAAKMLLDWGLEKADEEGWACYLDTSQTARAMYEGRGFELVRGVEFDRGKWGGEGVDWHGCMVREPQKGEEGNAQSDGRD
ncbi:hypothetical protein BU26DRAFT_12652 [Trematosphaeria pertusa]|uniref:N-acetyltransferase domain-containing protein n=1 Tax=Trematosphaeria pertusa TaxID=390896 RepID=A0A6A6J0X0_9PLEO|nr:uncharacterized protein BU26DRAFT_12652 [Trematosphaeria pertusa]KAF2255967.1 hypothetical protein BU26DRAFT_12652 [Trematosphaeria pertusa]